MAARVLLGMLAVQVIAAGLQILSRVILSEGTFIFALVTYRHVVAALSIAPFALFFERGVVKNLTLAVFFWIFMVALTGISMAMGLFYYGLKATSATYATNFLNLIPVITFLFATIFRVCLSSYIFICWIIRIEKLGLNTKAGKIRTLGAMLCLVGALSIALYKGKSFHLGHYEPAYIVKTEQNKTRGTMFLVASCLSYGLWFILQVKLFKVFPYKYCATLLTCIVASAQSAVIGLCIDTKPTAWRLGWNLQLVTIFYSGILATAATFTLISWAITEKGPTYPSMFNPLALILIAIVEALFLGEEITVGSLVGMAFIIVGLYSFLWGKHHDNKLVGMVSLKDKSRGGGDIEKASPEPTTPSTPSRITIPDKDSWQI
ncbi:hypothetical protein OROMI_027511 [Orobanche minor]